MEDEYKSYAKQSFDLTIHKVLIINIVEHCAHMTPWTMAIQIKSMSSKDKLLRNAPYSFLVGCFVSLGLSDQGPNCIIIPGVI